MLHFFKSFLLLILLLTIFSSVSFGFYYGLDFGAPTTSSNGEEQSADRMDAVAQLKPHYVRINFIHGLWTDITDVDERHGTHNWNWFESYDYLVNELRSRGVEIYGLINCEVINPPYDVNTQSFCDDYANKFVAVVEHFKDRVRIFESTNEPNINGLTEEWFAYQLNFGKE